MHTAGWIPQTPFTVACFAFAPEGSGTSYRAAARHWDKATQQRHAAMGFEQGWGIVAGQLAALAEAVAKRAPDGLTPPLPSPAAD